MSARTLRRIALLCGALAVVVFLAPAAFAYEKVGDAYGEGLKKFREKDYEAASAAFRAALKLDAKHAASRRYLADSLVQLQRHDEALSVLREGIADAAQRPTDRISFQVKIGDVFRSQQKWDEARAEYAKILEMDMGDQATLAKREAARYTGLTHFYEKRYEEAIAAFETSLMHDPEYVYSQYWIARCYATMKQDEKAVEAYAKAAAMPEARPNYTLMARMDLAATYERVGRLAEARKTLEETLAIEGLAETYKKRAEDALARVKQKIATP